MMVPWMADPRQEELERLQEKHSSLEEKFNKVTSEIGELKKLLQQLMAQGTSPPTNEPPSKKQATFATPKRPDRRQKMADTEQETEPGSGLTDPDAGQYQHMQE